jgi:Fe-S-cluster-containing hydrogenase component 2
MPKRINQELCIRCGICLPECPNAGITETEEGYSIESGMCSECFGFHAESRCVELCPAGAVEDVDEEVDEETLAERAVAGRPDHFPRD